MSNIDREQLQQIQIRIRSVATCNDTRKGWVRIVGCVDGEITTVLVGNDTAARMRLREKIGRKVKLRAVVLEYDLV